MNWYAAKIVFHIISGNGNHIPQFDEQLRLIEANTGQHALEKARSIGKQEEDEFLNLREEKVKWQFVDVSELTEIKEWKDGTEILSRIEEVDNSGNYIYMIKQRALNIEKRGAALSLTTA